MKEFFKATIWSQACNMKLSINDIYVFGVHNGNSCSIELPLNAFILNKANQILLEVTPFEIKEGFHNDTNCKLELISISELGTTFNQVTLYSCEVSKSDEIPLIPVILRNYSFQAMNHPEKIFLSKCEKMDLNPNLLGELNAQYKRILFAFFSKDLNTYLEIISNREKELAKLLFYSFDEKLEELKHEFYLDQAHIMDNTHLFDDPLCIKHEFNGKLISYRNEFDEPLIEAYNQSADYTVFYDFKFGLIEKELVVVR